jgi:hypothetical protein
LDTLNLSNWFMRGCVYVFLSFIMFMGDQVTMLAGFSLMCSGTHPAGAIALARCTRAYRHLRSANPHCSVLMPLGVRVVPQACCTW